MIFSHHNYLNLYNLCLLDTLLWLHEQYGDWTPKNDDLPPKYVFTHKTLFYWCCFTRGEIGLWIFSGCLTPDCGVCCICRSQWSNACKNMKEKLPKIVICHPNTCSRTKPYFTGAVLPGVKSGCEFFLDVWHQIVVCAVFAGHDYRMHAKIWRRNSPK